MNAQEKISRAIELLASAEAELAGKTRTIRKIRKAHGPNLERVAEFVKAETVAGDKVIAQTCWHRFKTWLPADERYGWTRNKFYDRLRSFGYRIAARTGNKWTIHGLALKAPHESP